MSFRDLFRHFREMNKYFIATTIVLIWGIVLGYAYPERFSAFLESQIQGLERIARDLSQKENPYLWFFGFIFINNALKSVLMVFSGALFGVLPIGFLLVNGMVLGFLASQQAAAGQLDFFLKAILPHGVIEIPAVVLACAYGIKFGTIVARGIVSFLFFPNRSAVAAEMRRFLRLTVPLAGLLIGGLLLAAFIESTVTPLIIGS